MSQAGGQAGGPAVKPPLMRSRHWSEPPANQATAHSRYYTQSWAATCPLARQRQSAVGLHLHNSSFMDYYSFNRPRRDGRLSRPCWLTDSGRFTHNGCISIKNILYYHRYMLSNECKGYLQRMWFCWECFLESVDIVHREQIDRTGRGRWTLAPYRSSNHPAQSIMLNTLSSSDISLHPHPQHGQVGLGHRHNMIKENWTRMHSRFRFFIFIRTSNPIWVCTTMSALRYAS